MQNEIIELSDSDTNSNSKIVLPVKKESTEISHRKSEVATLKAKLAAQGKLVAEQGKELNKLRKENKQFKSERDIQAAEITGLQDELKNILRQLDDKTVKSLTFNMIKLNSLKPDAPHGTAIEATQHQDVDQDMWDSFASNLPIPEDGPPNSTSSQPQIPNVQVSDSGLAAIKPEPEGAKIAVVIKSELEHEPDLNAHVTFVKSEDGKFDIWNLEHLRLGPPIIVEQRFHVGFRRSVISNALGGNWQNTFLNWQGPTSKSNRYPYMALKRSWNPHLPLVPGDHGVVFCGVRRFEDGTLITGSVDVVVSGKPNEWVYFGSYETSRSGEITPHQLHLLPPLVVRTWVEGTLKSRWGREWVEDTNSKLVDKGGEIRLVELTAHGLREALNDGRLVIGFTVMKCVGFRTEWFDQFLHYQAHPKLPTTQKRKKGSSGIKKPLAKRAKGSVRRKEVSSGSDSDEELQVTPPGSDDDEFSDA
ncbi:hypothetical protein CY34DRAFT_800589 [Suillus luteus UH-Slu-Lm8-n1]|uniref:DUF6697 domain-containing protein n=1 Tax=Suillus luteus UH-Slu-Lm8-n1 TaxID=930992 RepID=A0A0D0BT77_9AGAM|nr:hypothetical protein CY34DRAFT_800589 [Suillus luteus UH-Slu-Lm8-n1]